MDNHANPAELAALYEAAGIEPRLSTEEAADHIARQRAETERDQMRDAVLESEEEDIPVQA
jgi:hypothetical protein